MPSHKIFPTHTGYFSRSLEFFRDLTFFILCTALLIFTFLFNPYLLAMFLGAIVVFAIVYIIKIHRGEYVYFTQFFYQPVLFFLITPLVFLRIEIVAAVIFVGAVLVLPKKTFRSLDFPLGLFLSIFSVAISLILAKMNVLDTFANSGKFSLMISEPVPDIAGLFFLPGFEAMEHDFSILSLLENYGIYVSVFWIIFAVIRKSFLWDFLVLVLMILSFLVYYSEDIHFYIGRIVTNSAIWYFLYISIGRNFRALNFESFLSLGFSLGIAVFFDPNKYPPIVLIAVFFIFRSILAGLREKRIFQDIGILKTGFK